MGSQSLCSFKDLGSHVVAVSLYPAAVEFSVSELLAILYILNSVTVLESYG